MWVLGNELNKDLQHQIHFTTGMKYIRAWNWVGNNNAFCAGSDDSTFIGRVLDECLCYEKKRVRKSYKTAWSAHTSVKVHLMCFQVHNPDCRYTCIPAQWLTSIHRTLRPLHPNQFFSSGSRKLYRLHLCGNTSGMALTEGWEQHAICGFIKLLFTSLTSQGQLVGGWLAWYAEPECTRINRQNRGS